MTGFFEGTGGEVNPVDHVLDFHSDVYINTPTDGQILVFNGTSGLWENVNDTVGSVQLNLDDLVDVAVTPTDGQVLTYNAGSGLWVNATSSGTGAVLGLDGLTDVTLTSPTNGDRLQYDGGQWINTPASTAPANPITVGDGTDNTDAVVILNAGTVDGQDYGTLAFQIGDVAAYDISVGTTSPDTADALTIKPTLASTPAVKVSADGRVSINGSPISTGYELSVNGDTTMVNLLCSAIVAADVTSTGVYVNLSGIGSMNYKFDLIDFSGPLGQMIPAQNSSSFVIQARSSGGTNYDFNCNSNGNLLWRGNTIADANGVNGVRLTGVQTVAGQKTLTGQTIFTGNPAGYMPDLASTGGVTRYLRVAPTSFGAGITATDSVALADVTTPSGTAVGTRMRAALLAIADILGANPQKLQDIEMVLDAMEIM